MSSVYRNSRLSFAYPENWAVDESQTDDGLTVSLQSPDLMFVIVTVYEHSRTPVEIADEALDAMRDEYPDLESSPVREVIAKRTAVGHDVNFFSLDLTNTCWIRSLSAGDQSVLIFAQTNDSYLETGEQVFRAICASLEILDRAKSK